MKRISLLVLWGFCSMALSNVSFHGYGDAANLLI